MSGAPLGARASRAWRRAVRSIRAALGHASGAILYRGPSSFDGSPIVVVVTGLQRASDNPKTGDMLQVWIVPDIAEPPHVAVRTGADAGVCGGCAQRPSLDGGCYVTPHNAPRAVWQAVQDGRYPALDGPQAARLLAGALIRFGAWGDPAAVPLDVWRPILAVIRGHTGYTHAWASLDAAAWGWLMASVDTDTEHVSAVALGWRVFRVHTGRVSPDWRDARNAPPDTRQCPAAAEAPTSGAIACAACRLCDGNTRGASRPSVSIRAHGARSARYTRPDPAAPQ